MKGPHERLRQWLTGKAPYRCLACRWRGWAHDSWDRRQRELEHGHRIGRRADDRPPEGEVRQWKGRIVQRH
jgi:hypothetical protein